MTTADEAIEQYRPAIEKHLARADEALQSKSTDLEKAARGYLDAARDIAAALNYAYHVLVSRARFLPDTARMEQRMELAGQIYLYLHGDKLYHLSSEVVRGLKQCAERWRQRINGLSQVQEINEELYNSLVDSFCQAVSLLEAWRDNLQKEREPNDTGFVTGFGHDLLLELQSALENPDVQITEVKSMITEHQVTPKDTLAWQNDWLQALTRSITDINFQVR